MLQVTTVWSGFAGSPGYTNFHFAAFDSVDDVLAATHEFWVQLENCFPTTMTLSIDNAVKSLNPATGDLTSIENGTTFVAPVSGNSASGTGPAPAGACIGWSTGDVVNGHPVRGRTFLVPLAAGMYEGNGTLTTGALIDINDAVVSLVNATASFEIWHRPVSGLGGSEHVVTAGAAKDKVAVLRSRRD